MEKPISRSPLDKESFQALLAWLEADPEKAGQLYEQYRKKLIKIFDCSGCHIPEELADETINRVAARVAQIASTYSGNPEFYFYGVARLIRLEYFRSLRGKSAPPVPEPPRPEWEFQCLDECIGRLKRPQRDLILQYYDHDRRLKIENRKRLAQRLGIALNALRIKAFRIRNTLRDCLEECLRDRRGSPRSV